MGENKTPQWPVPKEILLHHKEAALACIGIIRGRLPVTSSETLLVETIVKEISRAFKLEGVAHAEIAEDNTPPKDWFW